MREPRQIVPSAKQHLCGAEDSGNDNVGRVRNPVLWERIVAEGGNEGTPESLRKRICMLKEAKVHDLRDGTSW